MYTLQEKLSIFKVFWKGFRTFEQTGQLSEEAYPAMRKLYVASNGWFNDIFHFLYNIGKRFRNAPITAGKFLNFNNPSEIETAIKALDRDGYYVIPHLLDEEQISSLMKFALETPCLLQYDNASKKISTEVNDEGEANPYLALGHAVNSDITFDPLHLVASNYLFNEEAVLNNLSIQTLMSDPAVLNIAQGYFRARAIFTTAAMWWTTPFGCDTPSSNLAQMYHFDMDRIKFLKFFCYLTDVTDTDGPHTYVKGSCKRKPKAVLRDGRFKDEEIEAQYSKSEIIEFIAPKGTIIVEDTRGFHKAKMPTKGNRLIMQFELANCLFGPPYSKSSMEIKSPCLQRAVEQNPYILSNFNLTKNAFPSNKVLA